MAFLPFFTMVNANGFSTIISSSFVILRLSTLLFTVLCILPTTVAVGGSNTYSSAPPPSTTTTTILVFPDIIHPEKHPRYGTTLTVPSTWNVFNNTTRFATLRGFSMASNNSIINYQETLSLYAPLGDIIWPVYSTLFAENFEEVMEYMGSLDLYITDLWGFVPGSGSGETMWEAYTPPSTALATLQRVFGNKSFGMDVGEQDGRYIGGYSDQYYPLHAPINRQRYYFEQHFQAMYSQLGSRVIGLQSLTFGHSMTQSGLFTLLGCETAQALVNGQIFYAITRGAGKMYGFLYFGNVSIYNRFGYKVYTAASGLSPLLEKHRQFRAGGTRTDNTKTHSSHRRNAKGTKNTIIYPASSTLTSSSSYACQGQGGPTCGTSLSLMIKLMFAQIMYNSAYVSFESSWFDDNNNLTPIGTIQIAARQWVNSYGNPGVHVATMALILDNAAGWTVPRHLYTANIYRTWGNLPYSIARGDYIIDNYLQMIYPSYRDSSYYHNETGFSSYTPYGDSLDILLSDAPSWLLARYDTLLLASTPQTEAGLLRTKLQEVLQQPQGNRIIAFAGAIGAWSSAGLGNCSIQESEYTGNWLNRCPTYPGGTIVNILDNDGNIVNVTESTAFVICTVQCDTGTTTATPIAWINNVPIGYSVRASTYAGNLVIFGSPFGGPLTFQPVTDPGVDASLPSPYPFLQHITVVVDNAFSEKTLFTVPGLTYTIARKNPTNSVTEDSVVTNNITYTLLVSNPTMNEAPLNIISNIGTIISLQEIIVLNDTIRTAAGYLPDGFADTNLGNSTSTTIAGVDTRIFEIVVQEQDQSGGTVRTSHSKVSSSTTAGSSSVAVLSTTPALPRPRHVALYVGALENYPVHRLQEFIITYPSVQQYFDTFIVDWTYISDRNITSLIDEAVYLRQTGFQGIVDFTSGLDLFPHLRLCNNSEPEYSNSLYLLTSGMDKVNAMGWKHVILSLHRTPENNMDGPTAIASFAKTLAYLANYAVTKNITLHLRNTFKNPVGGLSDTLNWLKTNNLDTQIRLLPNIGGALVYGETEDVIDTVLQDGPGSIGILGISCPLSDMTASDYTDTWPVTLNCPNVETIMQIVQKACDIGNCVNASSSQTGVLFDIVLVVDAFTGMDALIEPVPGSSRWIIPNDDMRTLNGPYLGPNYGTGSTMDLAYQEIRTILGWINYV